MKREKEKGKKRNQRKTKKRKGKQIKANYSSPEALLHH